MSSILIVEDSPDNMKLFRTLLELKGHAVTGMVSGDGLQTVLDSTKPDLVLMDIQLPGRDGYQLLDEIRGSGHRLRRVVALTAHAMSGDQERALAAGFDGYITKPIDIRAFPAQVERLLSGQAPEADIPSTERS
jgi:CheY-like chemotaxis protein